MLTLPLLGLSMLWIALLLAAKLGRMHAPPAVHPLSRNHLVQHLMEHDIFDDIAWYEGLIEQAVNADQLLPRIIRAKAYRRTRSRRWPTRPGDVRLDPVGKIGLIQPAEDTCEVKVMPLRPDGWSALAGLWRATNDMAMMVDIGPYGASSRCIRVTYIDRQSMPHAVRSLAKHAVQPHLIARQHVLFDGEHHRTVIGPCNRDRRC